MDKVKVWLGLDKNFNYSYYRVIGELDKKPDKQYFTMKFNRWTPKPKHRIHWLKGNINHFTEWKQVEQECVFKIVNGDNAGILLVELVKDEA